MHPSGECQPAVFIGGDKGREEREMKRRDGYLLIDGRWQVMSVFHHSPPAVCL
jgi:hypothetical protein